MPGLRKTRRQAEEEAGNSSDSTTAAAVPAPAPAQNKRKSVRFNLPPACAEVAAADVIPSPVGNAAEQLLPAPKADSPLEGLVSDATCILPPLAGENDTEEAVVTVADSTLALSAWAMGSAAPEADATLPGA